jgi:hypothetical protein
VHVKKKFLHFHTLEDGGAIFHLESCFEERLFAEDSTGPIAKDLVPGCPPSISLTFQARFTARPHIIHAQRTMLEPPRCAIGRTLCLRPLCPAEGARH